MDWSKRKKIHIIKVIRDMSKIESLVKKCDNPKIKGYENMLISKFDKTNV